MNQIAEQKEGDVYAAVATTIDARGNRSIAKTDEQGNIRETRDISEDPADDLFTRYTYNKKGNFVSKIDSKGNTVSYDYDRKSRVKEKSVRDENGSVTWISKYSYDMNDNLTRTQDYEVDGDQQILRRTKSLKYDRQGRLVRYSELDDPDPDKTSEEINEELLQNAVTFKYNKDGDITEAGYAFKEGEAYALIFTYDNDRCLDKVKAKRTIGSETVRSYEYDAVGNRIKSIIDGIETQYVYNELDQLTEESETNGDIINTKTLYTYDDAGNRTGERKESYTYAADKSIIDSETKVEVNSMTYTPENMMKGYGVASFISSYAGAGIEVYEGIKTGRSAETVVTDAFLDVAFSTSGMVVGVLVDGAVFSNPVGLMAIASAIFPLRYQPESKLGLIRDLEKKGCPLSKEHMRHFSNHNSSYVRSSQICL